MMGGDPLLSGFEDPNEFGFETRARARFKIFIEILFIGGHTMRILCGSCGFNTGAL